MANRRERRAAGKTAKGSVPSALSALLAEALDLYQQGKLPEAERAYRGILKRWPRDPDALYQFGVLAGQTGRLAEAERCLAEAVLLRPVEPAFHHGLGLLRTMEGRFAEALACHDKALALDAAHLGALAGRADALHELGDLAGADAAYRRAMALAPGAPEIRFGWATVLADLGRLGEAAKAYRELLARNPSSPEAHVNLGTVLRDLGQLDEAVAEFQQALTLKPDIGEAAVDLVSALCGLGRPGEALDRALEAMRRDPRSAEAQRAFSVAVEGSAPQDVSAETGAFLELCLSSDNVEHDTLARAAAWQLRQKHGIDASAARAARAALDEATATNGAGGCLADPLLHRLLARTVNRDLPLEAFLTEVRRLVSLVDTLPSGLSAFLSALALQAFNNSYVFAVGDDEAARVKAWQAELEAELARLGALDPAFEQKLLRFALYEPLTTLPGARRLLGMAPHETSPLGAVLERTLAEPLEEAELARDLASLGTIEDAVSRAVRDQYEANPYPRWFSLPRIEAQSLPVMLRRKFPQVAPPAFLAGPIEILVAGCGTGRQPIATALSFAKARVLAVDLSRGSLAYASRMARRLGAENVSFLHADLLALGELRREFPMIEAVGVLHHMDDPVAGWRALCRLLRPGGFMRIGLYSDLARADIAAARARIAAEGLAPSSSDIRAFRQRVLFGAETERLPRLARSNDIYDLNGCRDLLFHAKEHRFTALELEEMLAALRLEFVGFELADESIALRYRAEHPGDPAMTELASWARFETDHPDAFAGMYVFWCRKLPE